MTAMTQTSGPQHDSDAQAPQRRSIGARRNPAAEKAILDAAEAILAEKGPAGFSIEAVARYARAGKPTIYRWWPSRTALILAVYQRNKIFRCPVDTGNITDDVIGFLDYLFAYWRDDGAGTIFRSVITEAQSDPAALAALRTYTTERHADTSEMFERAMARGELRADIDPVLATEMLASFAWGRLLTDRLDTPPEELDAIARQFLAGLKHP